MILVRIRISGLWISLKEEVGVDFKSKDICRSRLVCRRSTKPRPIIVRLSRLNTKVEILQKHRELKQNKRSYNVQGDLSHTRRDIFKYLIKGIPPNITEQVWIADGVVCVAVHSTLTIECCATMAKWHEIVRKYSPSRTSLVYLVLRIRSDYDLSLLVNLHTYDRVVLLPD